jgi:hypothetical protein
MPTELDHVSLWVSVGGSEADRLTALGLTEGEPNRHPGQGTACRRFFFANAYLELLWIERPEEARGEVVRPLGMWERWSGRQAGLCPFGLILRPARQSEPAPPFAAWEYRPPYLPPPLALQIGRNAEYTREPLLYYLPVHRRPDTLPPQERQPLEHAAGVRELTGLRIFGPYPEAPSAAMQAAERTGAVVFRHGSEHLAELGFDGESQGRRADLRPALPLVMCW